MHSPSRILIVLDMSDYTKAELQKFLFIAGASATFGLIVIGCFHLLGLVIDSLSYA